MEIREQSSPEEESPIDQQTQDNYRVWKKNAPFLYDYLSTNSLLWPSLSVQFFPDLETKSLNDDNKIDELQPRVLYRRILLGTFTLGQSVDNVSILKLPIYDNLNSRIDINKLNYNSESKEIELNTITKKKTQVLQKINHYGDVNRARYMPQNPDLIAASNNLGDLVIYDRTKHPNFKIGIDDSVVNKPEIRLAAAVEDHHDIFAIDWNKQREGCIASADMGGLIRVYDIREDFKSKDQDTVSPFVSYVNDDKVGINDVEWIPNHDSIFTVVDDSGHIRLHDTRARIARSVLSSKIGDFGINSCSVNPSEPSFIGVGDSAGGINVFDIRTRTIVDQISEFDSSITQLKWHPKFHNILTASLTNSKLKIIDLGKKEVVFTHGGHMLGVNDFDWCLHDDWLIASVADDNSLHVWKPASNIVSEYK